MQRENQTMHSAAADAYVPVLVATLGRAWAGTAAALRSLSPPATAGAAWPALLERLERLGAAELHDPLAEALAHAWERLSRDYADPDVLLYLLALLTEAAPPLDALRQAAIEEWLLSNQPNTGRLLDLYRREARWLLPAGAPPPRWLRLLPALDQFFQAALPHALASVPDLRGLLPDADERDLIDAARRQAAPAYGEGMARIEALLTELIERPAYDQHISASEGGSIASVQQTIVVGQHAVGTLPPPDLAALYRRYQAFLLETFGMLDFRGILQVQNVVRLRLEDVYVPLPAQRVPQHGAALPAPRSRRARQGRNPVQRAQESAAAPAPEPLHHVVRDVPFLVVLGDPGAGKSTLVRALLLALARGEGAQRFGLHGVWLPILFPVAAFAEARRAPGAHDLAPLEYLTTYYLGLSQPDYGPLFRRALETGRALVLLDGLDEVREDRLLLVRCLEAFVREWDAPGNRFLATSRIAGYDEAPLDDSLFLRVIAQPLDDAGICCFIEQWSSAYERAGAHDLPTDELLAELELQRRSSERADDLRAAVFTNPNVTALARCPLLITILALIHQQGARLPDRRVDLYRLCVEALAETWNRSRSLSGREIDVYLGSEKLDERFVVNLLGPAALWMQEHQPGGLVERADLEQQLAQTLMQTDGLPCGRAQRLAQSFVDLMQYDTGLLQERGYRRFGFLHLTFEEYLAARALLESVTVQRPDDLIHARCIDPAWREVLRLMVAAASQREAQRLLLHLLHAPTDAETYGRPVVLAGECLLDIGRNSATQRAWSAVIEALVALLDAPQPALAVRIAGSRVLGELDDPRLLHLRSGDALAASYWCPVEAGPFWHSAAERAAQPLRPAELPYAFQIGRFPVTNAEYRCFIEAYGYYERRWWSAHGWAFLQARIQRGKHSIATARPNHWEHPAYNSPAQPVVGVSWYEAAAYCAWLTEQGHRTGWLPPDAVIRLPTVLEWERAARHTDQRRYPWGDAAPDPTYANYDDTGIHAPAPVGCFPAGAAVCGALDMAGNVWEWTATLHEQHGDPMPRRDVSVRQKPIISGGAFNWSQDYLHCGAHYWFSAGYRQNLLGFRLLWGPQAAPDLSIESEEEQ
jgi:formylglycine-generating enzyme required for sulfatase activity/energy-coupling factor transporter ATP-binding protein EcfA2